MQSANNNLGSVYVSGFTAANRLKLFAMCPFDAVATGVSTFCSQNYGAKKLDRIKTGLFQGTAVAVGYGFVIGILLIFFGRDMCLLFVNSSETAVLDAGGRLLFCSGFFYWTLGILNVVRLSTQGLGFSGRAIFSGVVEMIARSFVSLVFVPIWGFTAICFTDRAGWVTAVIYIVPTCMYCLRKIERELAE
ncbi:MAG: hypothetical protein LUF92_06955 [Clostridiales bacterium]|nr:hypothetical protein [Clostridiales bacterium]